VALRKTTVPWATILDRIVRLAQSEIGDNYPCPAEVTAMTATPPWWLPFGQLWALAAVLAIAFAPKWLPSYGRVVIRLPFGLVLIAAQTWGVLVYVPGRAVAVLTPPCNRPRLITNELTHLSRTHWHLSNFGAWPTGTGVGTVLLNHVCGLADAAQINTCLRASNHDNQRLYRRFGFRCAADSVRGTTMVRRFQPSRNPLASTAECEDVRLAGRQAKTLADSGVRLRTNQDRTGK
jgi:hypothetical protein